MIRHARRRVVVAASIGVGIGLLIGPGTASAHPLGNFSVNHAHALTFSAGRIIDDAVLDVAEIPTAQAEGAVDTNGDGTESPDELVAYGRLRCTALDSEVVFTIGGVVTPLAVTSSSFARLPGAAGLTTTRLECRLEAAFDGGRAQDVSLVDGFESDRIGWHEITAVSSGDVHLVDSPVPTASTTNHLRTYPVDLLKSPLNVRTATIRVEPGAAPSTSNGGAVAPSGSPATATGGHQFSTGGPLSSLLDPVTRAFDDLVGRHELTLGVGLLAVALALVLGASHALLPGHGKTVMAAYIAGRQGTSRDAFVVGATVTATHTGGVLLLGLALTVSSSLAGESVLAWLGVGSGLLIAGLGASLLIASLRGRPSTFTAGHHHGPGGHTHGPGDHMHAPGDHDHDHAHEHSDGHSHAGVRPSVVVRTHHAVAMADGDAVAPAVGSVAVLARKRVVVRKAFASGQEEFTTAVLEAGGVAPSLPSPSPSSPSSPSSLTSSPSPPPSSSLRPVSRRSLVGMGVAGGLVPSPSALVVLLSAIALGRTAFGVLLVVGYGVGMAATLTAAGLLLVRVRDRFQHRTSGRMGAAAARWQRVSPYLTASLVLVVGAGLALRSIGQL